jgi:hypothetical protein
MVAVTPLFMPAVLHAPPLEAFERDPRLDVGREGA